MTQQKLLHSLHGFILRHRLIQQGEKILLAVSGGIDSVVLLDLLCELRKSLKFDLATVHCNHRLRGQESDDDETFVRTLAKERGLDCYVTRVETKIIAEAEKISIQEAARNARYAFFSELRRYHGFHKIATAHNADDNAETIIFNLIRGTGIRGLTGIPLWRKDEAVIRPLLFASRDDIEQYSRERGLKFREDSSNLKTNYTRNFIRHRLIPMMRENINPNLTATLQRTSERFLQLEAYIHSITHSLSEKLIERKTDDQIVINLPQLHEQPTFIQEQFLISTVRSFARIEVQSGKVATMMGIAHGETGSFGSLSGDIGLYRDRDRLILKKGKSDQPFSFHVEINNEYSLNRSTFTATEVTEALISTDPCVEYVDCDKLQKPLRLRSWREGDWFVPFGMNEPKKMSDFFIDHKIPLLEKITIPLFTASEDIVWVCGLRLDDRYKITSATTKYIKLEYRMHE